MLRFRSGSGICLHLIKHKTQSRSIRPKTDARIAWAGCFVLASPVPQR
jgi:hypothetical protein